MDPNQIKQLRLDLGLTQEGFAKKVGVNWRQVQRWEAGDATPYGPTINLLNLYREEADRFNAPRTPEELAKMSPQEKIAYGYSVNDAERRRRGRPRKAA